MYTFVIPVFNEENSLETLVEEITTVCKRLRLGAHEILLVSDGSTDGTNDTITALQGTYSSVKGILLRKRAGKAAALSLGFAYASGKTVVTMDGDGQDDPAELPKLIDVFSTGYDMVSGWKQDRKDAPMKVMTSKIFNIVTGWCTGLRLHDYNCGYKIYTRDAAKSLDLYGELHRYIPVLLATNGWRVGEVKIEHRPRLHGSSKYGISRFFHGYFDLITILLLTQFRSRPLHFFGYIGLLFFATGFTGGLYLTVLKFTTGQSIGDRPLLLLSALLMIIGVQILMTGLLGEYILYVMHKKTDVKEMYDVSLVGIQST